MRDGVISPRPALLVALCLAGALLGSAAPARASVNAIVTASDCQGSSCSNFQVSFWGYPLKPRKSGKGGFKGSCLKTKSNSVGLFTANFNGVGPHSSGSKSKPSLRYDGRSYKRQVWITCGC